MDPPFLLLILGSWFILLWLSSISHCLGLCWLAKPYPNHQKSPSSQAVSPIATGSTNLPRSSLWGIGLQTHLLHLGSRWDQPRPWPQVSMLRAVSRSDCDPRYFIQDRRGPCKMSNPPDWIWRFFLWSLVKVWSKSFYTGWWLVQPSQKSKHQPTIPKIGANQKMSIKPPPRSNKYIL